MLRRALEAEGFDVRLSDALDAFNARTLRDVRLLVPHWTMGRITQDQLDAVLSAVESGRTALAGIHGGMCDAFRETPEWHFLTGGQWVAHPGNEGTRYRVTITDRSHPVTEGVLDFDVTSEQYYMHVDPAVRVLATTRFPVAAGPHVPNGEVDMPVVWTKFYGGGRVFYSSIGHTPESIAAEPHLTLLRRGFRWAAGRL